MDKNVFEQMGASVSFEKDEKHVANASAGEKEPVSRSAENVLSALAVVILVLGIVVSFVVFALMMALGDQLRMNLGVVGIIMAAVVFITYLIAWASIKVVVNISNTLKDIYLRM